MTETRSPLAYDLRQHLPTTHRGTQTRRARYAWIDEDPDLAPARRSETPLDAFG